MSVLQSLPQVDAPPHATESTKLVTERVYPPHQLEYVMQLLHESRATGTLMMDISQGGLCAIRFREEKKVTST